MDFSKFSRLRIKSPPKINCELPPSSHTSNQLINMIWHSHVNKNVIKIISVFFHIKFTIQKSHLWQTKLPQPFQKKIIIKPDPGYQSQTHSFDWLVLSKNLNLTNQIELFPRLVPCSWLLAFWFSRTQTVTFSIDLLLS